MSKSTRRALGWILVLTLAACGEDTPHSGPALWEVTAANGSHAWVFGTVHALPRTLEWKSRTIDRALARSDTLVLEIVDPADERAAREAFLRLGTTPGQPPLEARVPAELHDELDRALAATRLVASQFATLEDWAAALTLAFAVEAKRGFDAENGADRALQAGARRRPVVGLETLEGQLGLFDGLPPREQRTLLAAVVAETADAGAAGRLVEAWSRGDLSALDREAHGGMLAEPRLREALLVARNRRWAEQVAAMLAQGREPFVAVGAAHVAGTEGLPALLAARGLDVRRVQ